MKRIFLLLAASLFLAACNDDENKVDSETEKTVETVKVEKEEKVKEEIEKSKKLSLEEQSKKFIDENLDGKTITDFTKALITLENEKLENMIILGHKDGNQFKDDFDLLGRKAVATGKIIDFVELSRNTYNDRGKKSGSVTFTRDDKFYIYMGNKNINEFEKIEYDSLLHSEQDINKFFLGVYPEEVVNFALIDLDEDATLKVGDIVTVEGTVSNYVLRRDYTDLKKIEDFHVELDNSRVINN